MLIAVLAALIAVAPPQELATLVVPDGALGDEAGRSISFDGRRVLLGVPNHDAAAPNAGAAQLFRLASGGVWVTEELLVAPDAADGDSFGLAVSIDGDVALVGALDDDVNGKSNAGSAHVFRRLGGTWEHEAMLIASDGATNDAFGRSVALRGDIAVVGAWQSLNPLAKGAAYVFRRQRDGTWAQAQKLTPPDAANGDAYGTSLSFDGSRVLVGAFGDDVSGQSNQGSASVFRLEPNGSFTFEAKLTAADGIAFDEYGRGVAIDGELAVVGSWPFFGDGAGAACVFRRSGTVWVQEAKLVAPDAQPNDYFGFSVACQGGTSPDSLDDVVACGAWADDVEGVTNRGSVWVFRPADLARGRPPAWEPAHQLVARDGGGSDYFGFSLACSCEMLAIGVRLDDMGRSTNQGTARLWWTHDDDLSGSADPCMAVTDLSRDGVTGADDLAILLGDWGLSQGDSDIDGSGIVDAADLALLLGAWGAG